ncbi:hypothetical protein [Archangium violaceum]|uniref:hypothetical protein n=1 Tax=Archangium violaceum TaxID=83451 RepID=UPI0037BE6F4E
MSLNYFSRLAVTLLGVITPTAAASLVALTTYHQPCHAPLRQWPLPQVEAEPKQQEASPPPETAARVEPPKERTSRFGWAAAPHFALMSSLVP